MTTTWKRTAALICACAIAASVLVGCSRGAETVVDLEGGAKEDTSTLTPLERGEERRAALAVVRTWLDAWMDSDAEAMRAVADDAVVDPFAKVWDSYEEKGQRVKHVHEQKFLDVIDMNRDGTEALVTYRYDDDSYVVDRSGAKVKSLKPFKEKEIQLTLDKVEGEWRIVRIIAGEDAYR